MGFMVYQCTGIVGDCKRIGYGASFKSQILEPTITSDKIYPSNIYNLGSQTIAFLSSFYRVRIRSIIFVLPLFLKDPSVANASAFQYLEVALKH